MGAKIRRSIDELGLKGGDTAILRLVAYDNQAPIGQDVSPAEGGAVWQTRRITPHRKTDIDTADVCGPNETIESTTERCVGSYFGGLPRRRYSYKQRLCLVKTCDETL